MQTESVLKVFCVELPLDNNGKETKENFKVTGKTGKHSIHVHKSLDEKKLILGSYPCIFRELCMCCICKLYGIQVACTTAACK